MVEMGSANDFCDPQYWPEDGQTSADSQEFCRAYLHAHRFKHGWQDTSIYAYIQCNGADPWLVISSYPTKPPACSVYISSSDCHQIHWRNPDDLDYSANPDQNYIPICPSKRLCESPPPPKPPPSPPSPPPPPPIPTAAPQPPSDRERSKYLPWIAAKTIAPTFLLKIHNGTLGVNRVDKLVPMVIGKTVRFSANRNAETTSTSTLISLPAPIL